MSTSWPNAALARPNLIIACSSFPGKLRKPVRCGNRKSGRGGGAVRLQRGRLAGGVPEAMGFVLSKIFWAIAAPGNLLVLMLAVGTARLGGRRRRRGFRLVATATVVLLAIALLPIGPWAAVPPGAPLFPPPPAPPVSRPPAAS